MNLQANLLIAIVWSLFSEATSISKIRFGIVCVFILN